MPYTEDPKLPHNTARRRFLGVAAAAAARLAAAAALAVAASSAPAKAAGLHLGWGNGKGNSGGNGKSGGGGGGPQCFLRGTSILTDCGEKHVEALRIGDRVVLVGGKTSPIKWVGRQAFEQAGARWQQGVVPIRVSRQALDAGTPHSDLYLSPGHALFLNGVLIRVKDLVNGTTIAPIAPDDDMTIEYYAVLLATHEAIFAEGAAAETFHPSEDNWENFSNFAEYKRLFPGEERVPMTSYAPVLGEEGGWQHVKALLLLPLMASADPFEEVCKKISDQALELSN